MSLTVSPPKSVSSCRWPAKADTWTCSSPSSFMSPLGLCRCIVPEWRARDNTSAFTCCTCPIYIFSEGFQVCCQGQNVRWGGGFFFALCLCQPPLPTWAFDATVTLVWCTALLSWAIYLGLSLKSLQYVSTYGNILDQALPGGSRTQIIYLTQPQSSLRMTPPPSHSNFLYVSVPCIAYRLLHASGPLNGNRSIPHHNPYLLIFHKIILICERLVHFRTLHWALEMKYLNMSKIGWILLSINKKLLVFFLWKPARFKKKKKRKNLIFLI